MHLKLTSIVCAAALVCVTALGCASKRADATAGAAGDPAVLDINPTPAPAPDPVAYMPAPVPAAQPVADAPIAAGGGEYKVQKGDTLWKIASAQYGDGQQWKKICSANPGLTPESLKAGQTILIP